MLRNAIGGNSYTVMFGAVGPSSYNLSEIKNTLEYALVSVRLARNTDRYCARASTIRCKSVAQVQKSIGQASIVGMYGSLQDGLNCFADLRRENQMLAEERDRLNSMLQELKQATGMLIELFCSIW